MVKILTKNCWRQQKFCLQSIIFKYFWKVDVKGMAILSAKVQVSSTYGSDFNAPPPPFPRAPFPKLESNMKNAYEE